MTKNMFFVDFIFLLRTLIFVNCLNMNPNSNVVFFLRCLHDNSFCFRTFYILLLFFFFFQLLYTLLITFQCHNILVNNFLLYCNRFISLYFIFFLSLFSLQCVCFRLFSVYCVCKLSMLQGSFNEIPSFKLFSYYNIFTQKRYFSTLLVVSDYALIFFFIFSFLYPIIFCIFSGDYNKLTQKSYNYMYFVFLLSYFLLVVDNVFIFYFIYESIILLVFRAMYLSSNSRGQLEALIFYAGCAVLGSILVGIGLLCLVVITKTGSYRVMQRTIILLPNERFFIYLMFFFGFGVKLSVCPFWYCLPKAHVEVSTGMSIFLSCILIKLAYFGLIKLKFLLQMEHSNNFCVLVTVVATLDVVTRVVNVRDLKALVAHSSVVHTNLLLLLTHIDNFNVFKGISLYIIGHSLATAALFICINLIEAQYGTRNLTQVTGLCQVSPLVSKLLLLVLFSFIDLPLSVFYCAEFCLCLVFLKKFVLVSFLLIFFCNFIFTFIFFKICCNVLFGAPSFYALRKGINPPYVIYYTLVLLIAVLFLGAVQPAFLYVLTPYAA